MPPFGGIKFYDNQQLLFSLLNNIQACLALILTAYKFVMLKTACKRNVIAKNYLNLRCHRMMADILGKRQAFSMIVNLDNSFVKLEQQERSPLGFVYMYLNYIYSQGCELFFLICFTGSPEPTIGISSTGSHFLFYVLQFLIIVLCTAESAVWEGTAWII